MIVAIIAIAENYAIGKGGGLPWHYPADLKYFRETTTVNVVLSGSLSVIPPSGVILLKEKVDVIDLSSQLDGDMYIIGGAKIYKAFAEDIEKWLVTSIPESVPDADTFMPRDFLDGFVQTDSQKLDGGLIVKTFCRK